MITHDLIRDQYEQVELHEAWRNLPLDDHVGVVGFSEYLFPQREEILTECTGDQEAFGSLVEFWINAFKSQFDRAFRPDLPLDRFEVSYLEWGSITSISIADARQWFEKYTDELPSHVCSRNGRQLNWSNDLSQVYHLDIDALDEAILGMLPDRYWLLRWQCFG